MPFPTDPRLASYFLPGYPAAIAAAMAAVNAASYSLSSSPCLTTCSSSTSSSLPSMTKPTSSIWNMNPAAVVAAAAAAGTASSFWSTGCSGGGGSSSTSSGYASSEGSGGSNGTNGSNWLHHSAISPGSNSSIGGSGGSGGGSCGSGFSFLQYPYSRQHNLFNQKHYLRTSNGDDLISCIRRESPSFDRSVYFSNNNINNNNNNTNFSYAENHPIDYNLSGQISRFSNLYNDPVKNSASLVSMLIYLSFCLLVFLLVLCCWCLLFSGGWGKVSDSI